MKDWFDNLEARERLTLLIGGAVLLLALAWVLLINPLFVSAGDRAEKIDALRADVARARVLGAEIAALKQSGARPTGAGQGGGQSLLVIVEQTSRSAGLQVNETRPLDGSDAIRVRFRSASFDSLVRWMGQLSARYAIEIDIASLDRLDTEGMVDAQLTLKRPG